jgi:protein tyrosine phosphatase
MNAVSPKHDGDVFDKGKSPENKGKNRYSNIIPGEGVPELGHTRASKIASCKKAYWCYN